MGKQIDLTQGPIIRRILQFFFPILLGVFFQQLYNTVDAIVVGNFVGKEALAAVGGSASQIINLLVGFFLGLSSGATVLISQFFGGRQYAEMKSALHTTVVFSVVGGVLLTILGLATAKPLLVLMDTPEDTMAYSMDYMRVIYLGVIPSLLYNMGSAVLRAVGDSRRPLIYLIVCCVTNTVLDVVFVAVFHWEVLGAAVATSLSQVVSAVLVLRALGKLDERYRLEWKSLRLRMGDLKGILRIGFPAAVQTSTYGISNLLLMVAVNAQGTDTVAGWTATGKVDSVFWMIMSALNTTVMTFVGQNVGAHQLDRAKKGVRYCIFGGMGAALLVTGCILTFGRFFLSIFTQDEEVIRLGCIMFRYFTTAYCVWVLVEVFSATLRGAGDALVPMIINLSGICALRLVWIYVALPLHNTLGMICLSYPVTWAVTGAAFLIYYKKGNWTKHMPVQREE